MEFPSISVMVAAVHVTPYVDIPQCI